MGKSGVRGVVSVESRERVVVVVVVSTEYNEMALKVPSQQTKSTFQINLFLLLVL